MDHSAMHHDGHHEAATQSQSKGCVMKGTCKGPMSAILAILSSHGAPPLASFNVAPDLSAALAAVIARDHVLNRLTSPDTPPPRA